MMEGAGEGQRPGSATDRGRREGAGAGGMAKPSPPTLPLHGTTSRAEAGGSGRESTRPHDDDQDQPSPSSRSAPLRESSRRQNSHNSGGSRSPRRRSERVPTDGDSVGRRVPYRRRYTGRDDESSPRRGSSSTPRRRFREEHDEDQRPRSREERGGSRRAEARRSMRGEDDDCRYYHDEDDDLRGSGKGGRRTARGDDVESMTRDDSDTSRERGASGEGLSRRRQRASDRCYSPRDAYEYPGAGHDRTTASSSLSAAHSTTNRPSSPRQLLKRQGSSSAEVFGNGADQPQDDGDAVIRRRLSTSSEELEDKASPKEEDQHRLHDAAEVNPTVDEKGAATEPSAPPDSGVAESKSSPPSSPLSSSQKNATQNASTSSPSSSAPTTGPKAASGAGALIYTIHQAPTLPSADDLVKCVVQRNRSGAYRLNPIYRLYTDKSEKLLLVGHKVTQSSSASIHIFDMSRGACGTSLSKKAGNYLGKLVANNQRTEFLFLSSDSEARSLGAACYSQISFLQQVKQGRLPRKLAVIIPPIDSVTRQALSTNRTYPNADVTLLDCLKAGKDEGENCILVNKAPTFDRGNYRLNFRGRVKLPSVKNFQLVRELEQKTVLFQFGKVEDNVFHLDYREPLSAFQAFCVALTQFLV